MKRILILGARGQLGQDVCKACGSRGLEAIARDLPELDITDLSALRACVRAERPEALVNCAAYNAVDRAEQEFELALAVNALGPRCLALVAEEHGLPLMHFSSDYVFDGLAREPYTIADATNPLSRYGQSKLRGEQEVMSLVRRHFVVRLSWVFGAGADNFPRKVLGWARGRERIQVVDDQVACPAYTADLAPALLELLASGAHGLYHLANDGHCSRHVWAEHIVRLAGLPTAVEPVSTAAFPTPAARPAYSALNVFPLEGLLGRRLPDWRDATARFLKEIGVLS
jgi:dTDP-4-dehydrorhamnose reductase